MRVKYMGRSQYKIECDITCIIEIHSCVPSVVRSQVRGVLELPQKYVLPHQEGD